MGTDYKQHKRKRQTKRSKSMPKLIAIKIDVSKIDKARLYKGTKGTYLDATFFLNDDADQYGNHGMITQSVTKDERESGEKGAILGNVKVIGEYADKGGAKKPAAVSQPAMDDDSDSLPF
jgi:hypothetical protein